MKEKHLYLKGNAPTYELVMAEFDRTKIQDAEFLFKEAAILILYPDGTIEALKFNIYLHHTEYYKILYQKSKKFKAVIDSLTLPFNWLEEPSTYALDCYLASVGVSSLHNVSLHDLPYRPEELKDFVSHFYVFKAENITDAVTKNLNVIYANYPSAGIVRTSYSSEEQCFKNDEIEYNRRV